MQSYFAKYGDTEEQWIIRTLGDNRLSFELIQLRRDVLFLLLPFILFSEGFIFLCEQVAKLRRKC